MAQSSIAARDIEHVIAIAASAGGLEATSLLAQNLPVKQNCCYVIAQHMSPTHKSMLVQLLARETELEVIELDTTTEPRANTIFIPPPGSDVVFQEGRFELHPPSGHPAGPKPSADRLFTSLADNLGEFAIGIVLSGTGSDGSYGVQAIREAGGITIAQEPSSCKYDSMPSAAVRTGCIDLTLTPQQIGQHLSLILERPRDLSSLKVLNFDATRNRDLFQILLAHTRVDFRQYKESTINRRIERRMIAKGIEGFDQYVELCRRSVDEVEALYRDLLISVTRFFRDPEHFDALASTIRDRCAAQSGDMPIRVWIPGCATGEEAYTIAIILCEALGGLASVQPDQIQIFATDIDEHALGVARKGIYPDTALADIPAAYAETYFDVQGDRIVAKPKLRGMIMFSRHNVFQDAPFIAVDLVSIRNVLIYFNTRLQERVLTRILYALKPDGLLFLGTSETVGPMAGGFVQFDAATKIFRKRDRKTDTRMTSAALTNSLGAMAPRDVIKTAAHSAEKDWARFDALARTVLVNGLVTNRENTVMKIYGDLAPFSEITSVADGSMRLSLLKKPLANEAASLVLVCLKYNEKRSGQWHQIDGNGFNAVRVTAYPVLASEQDQEDIILIGFETEMQVQNEPNRDQNTEYVDYLEGELSRTRDVLQLTVEQLQTANEELQSVNEELQSANEELQSTNEEVETSNEELQSTNEELITVNEELLVNTSQLERTSAELSGLIRHIPATMLMLDQGLLIRYASDVAIKLFGIQERGAGYGHVSQCGLPEGYPHLVDICAKVIVDRRRSIQTFYSNNVAQELSVVPVVSSGDQLVGLIILVQSIRDTKSSA